MSMGLSSYTMQARVLQHGYPSWFNSSIPDFVMERFTDLISEEEGRFTFEDAMIVTAMSGEAYRNFVMSNRYLTFWQTGPTWHTKYSKDPSKVREFNDLRLFGQKAEYTAYAVLTFIAPPYASFFPYAEADEVLDYLQCYSGKGGKMIEWEKDVLEAATFTYGDSQQNILAFDFSPQALLAYVEAVRMTRWLMGVNDMNDYVALVVKELLELWDVKEVTRNCYMTFIASGKVARNPYFELQLHQPLTPDKIKRLL